MNKKFLYILISIIIIAIIISISLIYNASQLDNPQATVPFTKPYTPNPNQVIRVIDGDTFELGSGEIIRLLCIDTPEVGEEGYEEATIFLENLILFEEPTLEADIQDKDKYNRSLRYAYLNETFINKEGSSCTSVQWI